MTDTLATTPFYDDTVIAVDGETAADASLQLSKKPQKLSVELACQTCVGTGLTNGYTCTSCNGDPLPSLGYAAAL